MTGTIKTIVEGKPFGFISVEGREKDVFFFKDSVVGVTFEELKVGDAVTFDLDETGPKGPAGVNVQRAS